MSYLLEKDELNFLILFNGLIGQQLRSKPYLSQIARWDEIIFNKLLEKQPSLKKEYEIFKSEFNNVKFVNTLFNDIFDEKIELNNAIHFLFRKDHAYHGEPDSRLKLFINLSAKNSEFHKILHEEVKKIMVQTVICLKLILK